MEKQNTPHIGTLGEIAETLNGSQLSQDEFKALLAQYNQENTPPLLGDTEEAWNAWYEAKEAAYIAERKKLLGQKAINE